MKEEMKQELTKLKELASEISEAKKYFLKQRLFFNMKVEEKKNIENIEEYFTEYDSYESAKEFFETFPRVACLADEIRNEYPKYGVKKIKSFMVENLLNEYGIVSEGQNYAIKMVDNYFLYKDCGYFTLIEQERNISCLENEASIVGSEIGEQTKESVFDIGSSLVNIVRPYGVVAKGQLGEASKSAKELINKGSKQLVKIFQKIEEKTNQE